MQRYPSVEDLAQRARRRLPGFALGYLEGGAGRETALDRNTAAFDNTQLIPRYLRDIHTVNTSKTLFGQTWAQPFGISPVGLCGLIWPGTERYLASAATRAGIPYGLSVVATADIESIGKLTNGNGWFQLYTPVDETIKRDLLNRAEQAGFQVLVLTLDVPTPARRERSIRSGLSIPPRITARNLVQSLACPAWSAATLRAGLPRFRTLERYSFCTGMAETTEFLRTQLTQPMTLEEIALLRDWWPGTLLVKGIMHADDAEQVVGIGVDGIIVSNHGGRQIDSSPSSLGALRVIRQSLGNNVVLILDSGVRSGLDIARALATGADFVMGGRAFLYGVAALGEPGADHVIDILVDELRNAMKQIGCVDVNELDERWLSNGAADKKRAKKTPE